MTYYNEMADYKVASTIIVTDKETRLEISRIREVKRFPNAEYAASKAYSEFIALCNERQLDFASRSGDFDVEYYVEMLVEESGNSISLIYKSDSTREN